MLQLLGQLIATRVAVQLVLGLIGRLLPRRTISRAICSILDGSSPGSRSPAIRVPSTAITPAVTNPASRAQPQHLTEQPRQRRLVPADEPRDRRVIRHPLRRDHP